MKPRRSKMLIIGLTGGIGMGKSTVAQILRRRGFPIYRADQAVHALLRKGGKAVKAVAKAFPQAVRRGAIQRSLLSPIVFGKPRELKKLETILHPLVQGKEKIFLQAARRKKSAAAILEIPLLFETHAQERCDYVICVSAAKAIQEARVLRRPGMTKAQFKAIIARQMKAEKKRQLADFIIDTGGSLATTKKQLQQALEAMLKE